MGVTAMKVKSSVESLREVVQDLLVPELKALKAEMSSGRNQMSSIRSEMSMGFDAVRTEMSMGFDAIRTEMRLRDEKQGLATQALSDKLAYAIDIRERLAVLEDRSSRN